MTTLYGHTIRVLACPSCGAPVDASVAGGQLRCDYCGTTSTLTRRDESADRERAREGLAASMSESERHAALRRQDHGPEAVPDNLAAWIEGRGLAEHRVPKAQSEWLLARQLLASGSSAFSVQERFFYLTILLVPHLESRAQRATLETAAELLSDARHRHIVRCRLARLAAQYSDVDAARAWLETCNPRPTDLAMDTAYRDAAATLAIVEKDFGRVFELLGLTPGDVPLADREELGCEMLRAHAAEKMGQHDKARAELGAAWDKHSSAAVIKELRAYEPLQLCVATFREVSQQHQSRQDERELATLSAERRHLPRGANALSVALLRLPVWALLAMVAVSAVRCSADADPLMGVYGVPLCPFVCDGCEGPTRTVAIWHGSGGEYSGDGAQYFCSSADAPLASMNAAQIEESARRLAYQEMSAFAALGASFLVLLVVLAPLVPLTAWLQHQGAASRAEELDSRLAELCTRLGRAPPAQSRGGLAEQLATPIVYALAPILSAVLATLMILVGLFV